MVKINKTIISDTSDDGSSFFFHSTSLHNIGRPNEDKEIEEDVALETEDEEEVAMENVDDDQGNEEEKEEEEDFEEFPVPDIPVLDEAINEVPEDENVNIDILA